MELLVKIAVNQNSFPILFSDLISFEIPLTETVSPNFFISAFSDIASIVSISQER